MLCSPYFSLLFSVQKMFLTLVKDQFHKSANNNSVTLLGYARNSMKNFACLFSFQSPSFTLLSMLDYVVRGSPGKKWPAFAMFSTRSNDCILMFYMVLSSLLAKMVSKLLKHLGVKPVIFLSLLDVAPY